MLKILFAHFLGLFSAILGILLKCVLQPKITKNALTSYFGSLRSFKVIDVDIPEKFVTRA